MEKVNYTEGNLKVHFFRLLVPLIAGNILQQLYNTTDTFIIGRFAGSDEFAAVGLSSSIMNLLLFALIGFCTGVSVLFAQSYGANDMDELRQYHFQSVIVGTFAVIGISLFVYLGLPYILYFLKTPDSLFAFCKSYLSFIIMGLWISYLYNLYSALLRSIGKANIAFFALFLAVILNTGLDLLLIAKLHYGIRGAAIATVVAQGFSVLFCIVYLKVCYPQVWLEKESYGLRRDYILKIFRIGSITSVHQMSLYFGKVLIQGSVNAAGTSMISAYTATNRIEAFANSYGDSGYSVTSILIAQNLGAGKKERVKETFWVSLAFMIVIGVASSVLMIYTARTLSAFLIGQEGQAVMESASYLKIISIFYLFCFTGNTFAGYFDGLGKVQIPFAGALSHMTLRVILSYFWIPIWGLDGLAVATGIGWILVNIGWGVVKKYKNQCFYDILCLR